MEKLRPTLAILSQTGLKKSFGLHEEVKAGLSNIISYRPGEVKAGLKFTFDRTESEAAK